MDDAAENRRLGDFELIEPLGSGGMGVVYRARQLSLDREVALKVLRSEHAWVDDARRRFRQEVEAIAALHHPAIVPVHAVGETDGTPWFAMELVRGCTLGEALEVLRGRDRTRLDGVRLAGAIAEVTGETVAERAWLFDGSWVDTCFRIAARCSDALEHAHRRGVLHRDVKPANLMLTPDGRVLLVDFGVARIEAAPRLTAGDVRVGTPSFMSPEQLRGDEADPRSDVYALGVTLYEALTLTRAYESDSMEVLLRRIREGDHTPARRHLPTLSWDADVVCRTAMDPDPAQRYEDAAALRRDLEAVLEHRPIEARMPSLRLRAVRWVQRHPTASVAVGLGFLALVVAPLLIGLNERRRRSEIEEARRDLDAQRIRAETNYDSAVDALGVVSEIARRELRPIPGLSAIRERMLDTVLRHHLELVAQRGDDPRARWEIAQSLGGAREITSFRGDVERARAHADRAIEELRAAAGSSSDGRYRFSLARALVARARLSVRSRLESAGAADLEEAESLLEALDMRVGARKKLHSDVLGVRAVLLSNRGDEKGALAAVRERIRLLRSLEEPEASAHAVRLGLARAHNRLAARTVDDAADQYRQAAMILRELVAERPTDYDARIELIRSLDGVGISLSKQRRPDEAVPWHEEALTHAERLAGDFPNVPGFRGDLGRSRLNLAITLNLVGRTDDGLELVRRATADLRRVAGARPDDQPASVTLASALTEEARMVSSRAPYDRDAVLALLGDAIRRFRTALGTNAKVVMWRDLLRAALFLRATELIAADLYEEATSDALAARDLGASRPIDDYSAALLLASCADLAAEDDEPELAQRCIDDSLRCLESALEGGFDGLRLMETSRHLERVRRDPRYAALRDRYRRDD